MTQTPDITPEAVEQAIAELQDLVRCRCDIAYTDRGLKDPACEHDSAEVLQVVADRIEELEAKLAKAVGALHRIGRGDYRINNVPDYVTDPQPTAKEIALAVLAELKGEKNE